MQIQFGMRWAWVSQVWRVSIYVADVAVIVAVARGMAAGSVALAGSAMAAGIEEPGPARAAALGDRAADTAETPYAGAATRIKTIALAVGDQRQLNLARTLVRVAIGDPSVADVLVIKGAARGSVLFVGKAPGTTNAMVWEQGSDTPRVYLIEVRPAGSAAAGTRYAASQAIGWQCRDLGFGAVDGGSSASGGCGSADEASRWHRGRRIDYRFAQRGASGCTRGRIQSHGAQAGGLEHL
jgi:hypothetical protein